jgi:prepilin-type N-terminal cleavage/methylation domain-containing protein
MRLVLGSSKGLSLVEVIVALVILGVGVGALAGSFALVTRMVGRGAMQSRAAQLAASRLERLRLVASSTVPRCIAVAFANGGPLSSQAVTERWEVGSGGPIRQVGVIVSYPIPGGTHAETLYTRLDC